MFVNSYKVEWDTSPSFTNLSKQEEIVDASLHNFFSIGDLDSSSTYYVRVSAGNSIGYGTPQVSSPASANPSYQVPGKPHDVQITNGSGTLQVDFNHPQIPQHTIWCGGLISPQLCPTSGSQNEIQTLTTSSTNGGTFTLEYNGAVSSAISYQATSLEVQNAINSLSTIVSADISASVSRSIPDFAGYTWTIVFPASDGNVDELVADGTQLLGGGIPSIETIQQGVADLGEADGGSLITKYIVEWDTVATFDSGDTTPHAGEAEVAAHPTKSSPYSHTISNLTPGKIYYVRVWSYNNAMGNGEPCAQSADPITGECNGAILSGIPTL